MRTLIAGLVVGADRAWPPARRRRSPGRERRHGAPHRPGLGASKAGGALECLLEPSMVVNVGSSVDGVLEQVLVDRGDHVRKGQVVARLQSGVEAASVKVSEARVEYSRRKVERNEALFAQQLISAQERDEMVTEALLNQEELKQEPGNAEAADDRQPARRRRGRAPPGARGVDPHRQVGGAEAGADQSAPRRGHRAGGAVRIAAQSA